MSSQYLYFCIDDRGRVLELRVTRRGDTGSRSPSGRYGRSMTRDLSASYLRLEDLPPTYAEPVREHIRATGEQQGIVAVEPGAADRPGGRAGPDSGEAGPKADSAPGEQDRTR